MMAAAMRQLCDQVDYRGKLAGGVPAEVSGKLGCVAVDGHWIPGSPIAAPLGRRMAALGEDAIQSTKIPGAPRKRGRRNQ